MNSHSLSYLRYPETPVSLHSPQRETDVWCPRGYDVAGFGGGEFALQLVPCQRAAPLYWRSSSHTHTHTRIGNWGIGKAVSLVDFLTAFSRFHSGYAFDLQCGPRKMIISVTSGTCCSMNTPTISLHVVSLGENAQLVILGNHPWNKRLMVYTLQWGSANFHEHWVLSLMSQQLAWGGDHGRAILVIFLPLFFTVCRTGLRILIDKNIRLFLVLWLCWHQLGNMM